MPEEMASRISQTRSLLPTLEASLKAFQQSPSTPFKIIRSVNPSSLSTSTPNTAIKSSSPVLGAGPRTLFILDSSYNPPSRAHLAMATTALRTTTEPTPKRLLLLFSTSNADKAPKPASFEQRLAMMTIFAQDLQSELQNQSQPTTPDRGETDSRGNGREEEIGIDIGVTIEPYYTSKSHAIASAVPPPYPSNPTHIHLLGYDTLIRFLAPKYYSAFHPPLSALAPYFESGHKLLVLLRPATTDPRDSEQEQRHYISSLSKGHLQKEGFKRNWADQIGILEGGDIAKAAGISSTLIRTAVKAEKWDDVEGICTPGIATWIREESLYND
ncbi:Nucleotidylyl transferase [Venturia nashicola]|nr:Nucleotidylyl transferase [Venturia nashicola]